MYVQTMMTMVNGLALYKKGDGTPVFLMPYPHASGYQSMIESPLTKIFNDLGFSVLTFDPPEMYNSVRKAEVTLEEMLLCANELLSFFKLKDVFIAGHSQSGFCALAYSIEFPKRVKKLLLIGSVSGWPMMLETSIHKQFGWNTKIRWQLMYWGIRKMLNKSNLLIHKKLDQLVVQKSYVNQLLVPSIKIFDTDKNEPEPVRAKWMVNMRKFNYDYSKRLNEISIPVLICAGKQDLQTPVKANMELYKGMRNSEIEFFEKSGHFPYIEEKTEFVFTVKEWVKRTG